MDKTLPIVPTFNGQLGHSSVTLCDFTLITTESDVPVTKIIIVADGKKHKFPVGPGKYKMALFLLYCAVLKGNTSFLFDADLWAMLEPYFSTATVENARLAETSHAALQLLILGTNVEVNIVLKPGYELPKGPGRTVHKLIEHAWNQQDQLNPDSPAPLIRQAIEAFWKGQRDGTIGIIYSWSPQIWPSDKWVDRVRLLTQKLGMRKSV